MGRVSIDCVYCAGSESQHCPYCGGAKVLDLRDKDVANMAAELIALRGQLEHLRDRHTELIGLVKRHKADLLMCRELLLGSPTKPMTQDEIIEEVNRRG